jgi:sec-independent protein translocase protein TatA
MNNSFLALISMPQGGEWIIIMVIVLLLFGAKKLPQLARGVGKSLGEFKKARDEFEQEVKRAEHDVKTPDSTTAKKSDDTEA